jgi:MFS family permease
MTSPRPPSHDADVDARPDDLSRTRQRRLLSGLAITQTIGYGALYYAFAVFLTPMATDLHASATTVAGALTCGLIVTAAAAVPVGRWIDRHGTRRLMTVGSLLGTAAVVAWSQVHSVGELYAVFVAVGLASAMVLYEPAFAAVIRHVPPRRRADALLTVTIVAGFSSSIFLPAAGIATTHSGWRSTALALSALLACTIPIHAAVLPPDQAAAPKRFQAPTGHTHIRAALRDRGFWLLETAFAAQGAAVATIGVLLVTYLIKLGHPAAYAAAVAGLLGVLSVTGRLATTGLHRRYPVATITAAVFALQGGAIAALPWLGRNALGAVGCVVAFGLGFGVATIARPAILASRYPVTAYAGIAGTMATPVNAAKAIAPVVGAALAEAAGYTALMVAIAVACVLAAGCLILLRAVPSGVLSETEPHARPTPEIRPKTESKTHVGATDGMHLS